MNLQIVMDSCGDTRHEFDPANTKLCHRVSAKITDDDLLFLKQIGLRWARVEFGEGDTPFEAIRATQAQ